MDVLTFKRFLIIFILSLFNTGCQLTYLLKSAYNQFNILYHREPIDKILADPNLDIQIKNKLLLVQKVREFSKDKLNLNIGKNYSTYVDLKRPYVVWSVNAAPKWKLEHHLWYFPIIGNVPYKGFPSEEEAKEEAQYLEKKGLDTYVRGVSAYSTLGWFNDPLLSSMMRYSEEDLTNTIIHESVHATLYIKSNADFNERLATFIGDKGTELFYQTLEGNESYHLAKLRSEAEDQKLFSEFISHELDELKLFYQTQTDSDESKRDSQFQLLKTRFREKILPKLKTPIYLQFDKSPLNNARLLLFKTYIEDLSDFQALLDRNHGDLNQFLIKVKTLEGTKNPVEALKSL